MVGTLVMGCRYSMLCCDLDYMFDLVEALILNILSELYVRAVRCRTLIL